MFCNQCVQFRGFDRVLLASVDSRTQRESTVLPVTVNRYERERRKAGEARRRYLEKLRSREILQTAQKSISVCAAECFCSRQTSSMELMRGNLPRITNETTPQQSSCRKQNNAETVCQQKLLFNVDLKYQESVEVTFAQK